MRDTTSDTPEFQTKEDRLFQFKAQKDRLVVEKKGLEDQIRALKNRLDTGIGRIHPTEFEAITRKRNYAISRIRAIDIEIIELKPKIQELGDQVFSERFSSIKTMTDGLSKALDGTSVVLPDGFALVRALRDKYSDFAEDQTRVGSMRVMAASFAKELTEILDLLRRDSK